MTIHLDDITLARGSHSDGCGSSPERCLFEWYNWLTRSQHTDSCPPGVSPVLHAFGIRLNDALPDDRRQELKRFLPNGQDMLAGTADDGLDLKRLDLALAWSIHHYAVRWLELAGLPDEASKLRAISLPSWPAAAADDVAAAAVAAAVAAAAGDVVAVGAAAAAVAVAAAADDAAAAAAAAVAAAAVAVADDAAAVAAAAGAAAAVGAVAAADAVAAAAADARLREVAFSCRWIGYRAARVLAFRAAAGHTGYEEVKKAAREALNPAVAEFQAASIAFYEDLITVH